jgi:hypothetical protein
MSEYNKQDIDFVKRTVEILEFYEKLDLEKFKKYEVTLFINCLTGLLIIPKQVLFERLKNLDTCIDTWGISKDQIICELTNPTVGYVAEHLRNAVAHYRFELISKTGEIQEIQFCDKKNSKAKKCNFIAIIPISNLRKFIHHLVKYYLNEMGKSAHGNA